MPSSLRIRSFSFALLATIPLLTLMVVASIEERGQATVRAQEDARRLAALAARDEEQIVESTRLLLVTLTHVPAVRSRNAGACGRFLADVLEHYPLLTNLNVAEPDGKALCSAVGTPAPLDSSGMKWFRRAVDTKAFAIGDYQIGRITGKPIVVLAVPGLGEQDQVEFVIAAALDLAAFSQFAGQARLPDGTSLTVTDDAGTILARYPEPDKWVGQSIAMPSAIAGMQSGAPRPVSIRDIDDIERIIAFTEVGKASGIDLYLAIGIPSDLVFVQADERFLRNLEVLALIVLLEFIAIWKVSGILVLGPVRAVLRATNLLRGGQLDARSGPPYVAGELGELASSFDDMAGTLQHRYVELQLAEAALRRYTARLQALRDLDLAILAARSPTDIAEASLRHLRLLVPYQLAKVVLYGQEDNAVTTLAVQGQAATAQEGIDPSRAYPASLEVTGDAEGLECDPAQQRQPAQVAGAGGDELHSYVSAPLQVGEAVIGSISVAPEQATGFESEVAEVVQEIALSLALAIEQARLNEQVFAGRERLVALSRQLVSTQEAERRRIARELHDELGQDITGLKLLLDVTARVAPDSLQPNLTHARLIAGMLLAKVRELSLDLRPAMLDDLGLLPAVLWLCGRYSTEANLTVSLQHDGLGGGRLPADVETAAYRIIQEALTNVARHAGVSSASTSLWLSQKALNLRVEDHGIGFVPSAETSSTTPGMRGMRERANLIGGRLVVESSPGAGTRVIAELPLHHPLERRASREADHDHPC